MQLRKISFNLVAFLSCFLFLAAVSSPTMAQGPAAISATTIPESELIQPADLAKTLTSGSPKPLVLQVGPKVFFQEARITGSKYGGAGSSAQGLQLLEKTVLGMPKDQYIVLYCGCCPWNRCPNVGPAFARLRELGYTNVKVLYLANNFGDDWVRKGYPQEH